MGRRDDTRDRRPTGAAGADAALNAILALLAAQSLSAWFDTAWTPGVTLQDDSGTTRMTAMQSRPIAGQSQYTVSQGTLSISPAVSTSPSGKRVLIFAGAQYLSGAATLAAQFQATATYTAVSFGSRNSSSSMTRWSFGSSSADNRINHGHTAAGTADQYIRAAAGSSTANSGSAITNNTPYIFTAIFSGAAISTWLSGTASMASLANVRSPASLDAMVLGAQMNSGTLGSFWSGLGGPVAICAGALSTPDRQSLERNFGAYYGVTVA